MASNSNILQILLSIETMAKHLAEPHLLRQYENKEQGPILMNLINITFCNLKQCVDILRPCTPISRLPNELLGLIFQAAQDDHWATPFQSVNQIASIPLTLSQVSRSWRDVSLRTLSLMVDDGSSNWFGDVGVCFPGIEILVLEKLHGGFKSGSLLGGQGALFLPNLRSLSLQDITEASETELCKFIARRKAAGVTLPDISLNPTCMATGKMCHLDWLKTQVEVTGCGPWPDRFVRAKVFDEPEISK